MRRRRPVLFDGDDQRPAAQAASRRRRATASSSCSIAPTARRSSRRSTSRRTGRSATTRRASRFPNPGEDAADRRRARDAEPGRRDQLVSADASARRRACSTSTRRARSASSTSTIRATIRWAGAAPIAAATPSSRCCRRSTTRPARSAGAIPGRAAAHSGLLSTAGNVVFTRRLRRPRGAQRDDRRAALARAHRHASRNGPITYELDGEQYVVVGSGQQRRVAFVMNR